MINISTNITYDYCLNILINNKAYIIHDLKYNEAYKKLENMISDSYMNNKEKISFKSIPIDVYIKDDLFYADLEIVNLN